MLYRAILQTFLTFNLIAIAAGTSLGGEDLAEVPFDRQQLIRRSDDQVIGEPSPSGKWALITDGESGAFLFDPMTGHRASPRIANPEFFTEVHASAFSPDERRVALGDDRGIVEVFDARTGKPASPRIAPLSWEAQSSNAVASIAFSADGKLLIIACHSWVRLLDSNTGRSVAPPIQNDHPYRDSWDYARLSPDGKTILTFTRTGFVSVWNAQTGALLHELLDAADQPASSFAKPRFSPDGSRIAGAADVRGFEPYACVWETSSGRLLYSVGGFARHVFSVAFSRDGKQLAVGAGGVRVYDALTGDPRTREMGEDRLMGVISCVGFSPDGTRVVGAGPSCEAKVWDIDTQKSVLNAGAAYQNYFAAFNAQGTWLITSGSGEGSGTYVWKVPAMEKKDH